jgi:hypothetical protein
MNIAEMADRLQFEWSAPNGFLYGLSYGRFDPAEAERFSNVLQSIDKTDPRRFDPQIIGRVWSIPYYMLSHIHNSERLGLDVRDRRRVMLRANDILAEIFTGRSSASSSDSNGGQCSGE